MVQKRYVRPPGALSGDRLPGGVHPVRRCARRPVRRPRSSMPVPTAGSRRGRRTSSRSRSPCIACADMPCAAGLSDRRADRAGELAGPASASAGSPFIPDRCITFQGQACAICVQACPDRADGAGAGRRRASGAQGRGVRRVRRLRARLSHHAFVIHLCTAGALMADVPRRVDKPWGYELIWAHTDRYVGKILHVKAGHLLSIQYHHKKDETMHVLSGELILRTWADADGAAGGARLQAPASRCTFPRRRFTRSRRWSTATCSRPRRRNSTTWSASPTVTGEADRMQVIIPLAGKGTRLRPHTHLDSQADAQGGGPAGDGLGDGPARGAAGRRADLHHRASQGAGRGSTAGAHYAIPSRFIEQKVQDGTAGAVNLARPFVHGPGDDHLRRHGVRGRPLAGRADRRRRDHLGEGSRGLPALRRGGDRRATAT